MTNPRARAGQPDASRPRRHRRLRKP